MDELKRFEQAYWRSRASADNRNYGVDVTVGDCEAVLAELTRLRAELDEARRHAKVLAEVFSPYKEYSGEVEAALDYVEKLP